MAEANDSVHQARVRATMGAAVMTLAKQRAIKATKAELQAQGLRPSHIPHCQIVARANQYLTAHRDELIKVFRLQRHLALVDARRRLGHAKVPNITPSILSILSNLLKSTVMRV